MEDDILRRMAQEEADLLRKLEAVRAFRQAYGATTADVARSPPAAVSSRPSPVPEQGEKRSIHNFTEYGRQVIATAMACMIDQHAPVKTRLLVEAINARGLEIRGENPINALGALLKRSADITSHGKSGWTLSNPDAAREIVGKYAYSENEPPSVSASGSDAAGEGAPPPEPAQDQLHLGQDA